MQPVHVDGRPVVAMDLERQSLFALRLVDHDGAAVLRQLQHSLPQLVADPNANLADENACADFEQPACEMATQTRGARREHQNYHGTSSL